MTIGENFDTAVKFQPMPIEWQNGEPNGSFSELRWPLQAGSLMMLWKYISAQVLATGRCILWPYLQKDNY